MAWPARPRPTALLHPGTKRPARPKARHSTGKLQARQAAPASGVRPESGTPVRKIGHKTHTGTIQFPHSERPNIRITFVTCLYDNCTATVRPSRNHLTNVVLAAQPVVVHPSGVGVPGDRKSTRLNSSHLG